MHLEFFLARRYLSSHKGRGLSVITWIALAGVVVGVMSLVTVLAVMSGFDKELRTKILGNSAHIIVQLSSQEPDLKDLMRTTLQAVKATEDVASAMPAVYGEAFILGAAGTSEGAFVKGVDPRAVNDVLDLKNYVHEGNWDAFTGTGVVVGDTLAKNLGLKVGDSFTMVLNRGDFSPLGVVPRMRKFQVVDTFHSGMTQFDGRHVYMPLSTAEELFESEARVIEVKTTDVRKIDLVKGRLREKIPMAIQVQDWISQNKDFLSALRLEKTAMAVILGLIVLVASFNICGSLIMIVRDKTKDIAILKSMGASDRSVLKIFFLQGTFIGIVGTVVGLILGLVLSVILRDTIRFPLDQDVYMIDMLPVDLRLSDGVMVCLGSLFISCLATLYPARLAAGLEVTEGLKAE